MNLDEYTSECGLEFIDNDEHLLHHLHQIATQLDRLAGDLSVPNSRIERIDPRDSD